METVYCSSWSAKKICDGWVQRMHHAKFPWLFSISHNITFWWLLVTLAFSPKVALGWAAGLDLSCDLPGLDLKHSKRKEKALLYDQKSIFPSFHVAARAAPSQMWTDEVRNMRNISHRPVSESFCSSKQSRKWAKILSASVFSPQHLFQERTRLIWGSTPSPSLPQKGQAPSPLSPTAAVTHQPAKNLGHPHGARPAHDQVGHPPGVSDWGEPAGQEEPAGAVRQLHPHPDLPAPHLHHRPAEQLRSSRHLG